MVIIHVGRAFMRPACEQTSHLKLNFFVLPTLAKRIDVMSLGVADLSVWLHPSENVDAVAHLLLFSQDAYHSFDLCL